MARRRRKGKSGKWVGGLLSALLAFPALYFSAALVGSLVPVNRGWTEPAQGTIVYIADNGIHADIIMPVDAQGLDWGKVLPKTDFAAPDPAASWIAFGSGEEQVYLNTPTWWDITPRTLWAALAGGKRVMHVEYVANPILRGPRDQTSARRIPSLVGGDSRRLRARSARPAAADRPSGLRTGRRLLPCSTKANAVRTCNAGRRPWLRLAGVKTSIWPPFVNGLVWRYRRSNATA